MTCPICVLIVAKRVRASPGQIRTMPGIHFHFNYGPLSSSLSLQCLLPTDCLSRSNCLSMKCIQCKLESSLSTEFNLAHSDKGNNMNS